MMKRKLVSIQKIEALESISGADFIERARVLGWTVVVKKGEFEAGDLCMFFEIDSVLPDGPSWSEFMRKHKFRVKTVRLKQVLSQGLALPIPHQLLPDLKIGDDVTEKMGVTKYEPPLPECREVEGKFPSEIPKTDELRIQSFPALLQEIKGKDLYISTKYDGMSATFYKNQELQLIACSRNWSIKKGNNNFWNIVKKYDLENILPANFAIQGELCGPKIQKNRLGLSEIDFFVFNVYDVNNGDFLDYKDFISFCEKYNLKTVPIEEVLYNDNLIHKCESLEWWLIRARGFYANGVNLKEGIVVRPLKEEYSSVIGGRLSFKVLNNDFLLQED